MSKLNEMIEELCPNGVVYKKLGEIAKINRGIRVTRNMLLANGEIPVYQNALKPLGYFDKSNKSKDTTFVISGGAAGQIGYSKIDFWAADDCYTFDELKKVMSKYIYYFLQTKQSFIDSKVRRGSIPRISRDVFENIEIPVPPLGVQAEIVRILDKFTELHDLLERELVLRRKQYEWTQQKLLNIRRDNLFALQDICTIEKGKTPIQKAIPGKYPLVVTTDKRNSCNEYQFDCKAVCLSLVSARGHGIAQITRVFYQEGKFALGNILCAMIPKDEKQLNAKYLRYYLFFMKDVLLTPLMKGGANVSLHISDLQTVKIPVPPLSEQERIVGILDRFEALCHDLSQGLPAEIAARQKQYEYYRDKLLTFKRKAG